MTNNRISLGSWLIASARTKILPFHLMRSSKKLASLRFDGVEPRGFPPDPSPAQFSSKTQRDKLRRKVVSHGLAFSGLAANLWWFSIVSQVDQSAWMDAFESNLNLCCDLGIDAIRFDTASPPHIFEKDKVDPQRGWERVVNTFRAAAQ
ncbi:MAG: hypothetical protein HY508_09510 [Acidobacteria bacterium]|nr:hypothetical protein [Acidobacteriota bacterium]